MVQDTETINQNYYPSHYNNLRIFTVCPVKENKEEKLF